MTIRRSFQKAVAIACGVFIIGAMPNPLNAQTYISLQINQPAALQVDAGPDAAICVGDSIQMGGAPTASLGTAPYQYEWTPVTGLSGASVANPMTSPASTELYVIKVTDLMNCTQSDSVLVIVDSCIGIAENPKDLHLQIYPNPNRGRFTITIDGNPDFTEPLIEVFNIFGQVIWAEKITSLKENFEMQIDISGQAGGIYFVRLQDKSNIIIRKILVE